ncbi:MAG: GNAT family N-acetyltransferase [Acidimicrobiales bacterium]
MPACPTIETERLVLRPLGEGDLDRYFAIHTAPDVRASLHKPDSYSPDDAWTEMALMRGQWALRNSGQWAVELRDTGELIGRAGTHRPQRADWPGLECGWTFDPAHWGRGYATEAGRATVEWAFANHDDDHLYSVILPTNRPSQAVAKRLGFTLLEERTLAFFPSAPHGIWVLPRPQ